MLITILLAALGIYAFIALVVALPWFGSTESLSAIAVATRIILWPLIFVRAMIRETVKIITEE